MVLKNKDGTVFKLRGPNLLLKEQNTWTKYKTHNMKWKPVVQEDNIEVAPLNTNFNIKDKFLEELQSNPPEKRSIAAETNKELETKNQKESVQKENYEKNIVIVSEKKETIEQDGLDKSFVYCLPAILQRKKDVLYDEEFVSVSYGKPFSFEAVITEEYDLCLNFWTTTFMEKESVIFPKTNFKRWWKIVGREQKTGGYLYVCGPSSYQPHFENI